MATRWLGAMPPPPGVEPNFVDPQSQMQGNIALHTLMLTLVTLAVAMRLYTRSFITRAKLGVDDYFCFVSYLLTIAFSGLMIKSYTLGIGRHLWDEPIFQLFPALKYFTFAQYVYLVLAATIKLTLLLFYLRVFAPQTASRYFIIFGIVFVAVTTAGILFATIFACTPVARAWNAALPGHCINPLVLPYLSGALNTVTDIYALVIPIRLLWGLNMKLRRKLKVVAVFCLGIFACAASIVRLAETHVLQDSADATWNISRIAIWAVIEVNIGLICACLLLLPAFLDRHWPKAWGTPFSRLWSYTVSRFGQKSNGETSSAKQYDRSWPGVKFPSSNKESQDFVRLNTGDRQSDKQSDKQSDTHSVSLGSSKA